jgi:hypothetical protein
MYLLSVLQPSEKQVSLPSRRSYEIREHTLPSVNMIYAYVFFFLFMHTCRFEVCNNTESNKNELLQHSEQQAG